MVFTTATGKPLRSNAVRRQFCAVLEAAGLPRITLYDATRHTSARLLAAQGVHPKIAQRVLGHAQIATTMNTYTHVAPEGMREAADAINRALN